MDYTAKQRIVILPTFEDSESTYETIQALTNLGENYRIVIIEDGSIKNPVQLTQLKKINSDIELLVLQRNYGNQRAIALGLRHVHERYPNVEVVLMDSDGEDRPEFVPALFTELSKPGIDVVVAARTTRENGLIFKVLYSLYKVIFRIATGKNMDFGNFCALKPIAITHLIHRPELWMHIGATILSSNLRILKFPLPRGKRYFGKSRTNSSNLIQHGIRSVNVFSNRVIVRYLACLSGLFMFAAIGQLVSYVDNFGISIFQGSLQVPLWLYFWILSNGLFALLLMGVNQNGTIDVAIEYQTAIAKISQTRKKV